MVINTLQHFQGRRKLSLIITEFKVIIKYALLQHKENNVYNSNVLQMWM